MMTADHDKKVEEAFAAAEDSPSTPDMYWKRFLNRNNLLELREIESHYPRDRTITVDVGKVNNNEVWDELMRVPLGQEDHILDAAKKILKSEEHNYADLRIRYINIKRKKKIKELRTEDEVKLTSIKALVKRSSEIRPKVITAFFTCPANHIRVVHPKNDIIPIPRSCTSDGCDFRTFDHLDSRDIKINRQWLYIQDPLEDLTDGGAPSFLKCEMIDDLCGRVIAGDRVIINGVYRSIPKYHLGKLTAGKDVYFDVRGIEINEREFEEVKVTESDEAKVRELAKSENLFDLMSDSVAPSIMGMKLLKRAIILMLFEGVTRKLADGIVNRGHLNVLVVSDPSMAKTKLLRFVASIAPRGVFTNATTSTKVGLVAPIIRDETTGEYTVQAGAYMIASGGILCLDEVSELDKADFKYLNEAMEDGEAHITKGGLNITVKTRASLLAACNPIEGSFDNYRALAEQVKIPESTLSRFDLKILLQDISSEVRDRSMIEHITQSHMEDQDMSGLISPDMLRKYIAVGRKLHPKLNKPSKAVIDDYYVKIRKECGDTNKMKITPRQGTACIRLAEAHARMRLSENVEVEDARAAIELFDMCFRNVATDPTTGQLDAGRVDHRNKHTVVDTLIKAIRDCGTPDGTATEKAIMEKMAKFDPDKIRSLLRSLKNEGKLIEPRDGLWKVM